MNILFLLLLIYLLLQWQSSFLWGYLVSPIAGGALVDYYGGKTVMGWGVALWSFATFLTPWAAEKSLWALLAIRATLGIAEGVALPSMNNMISKYEHQMLYSLLM